MANGNGNGRSLIQWWPLVLSLIAGAAAFASLRSDVQHNEEALAAKANVETVNVQYQTILDQIKLLRDELKLHEVRSP